MVLEGVESINWFTDRPQRAEGSWKPKKLVRQWDKYFADSEPNAQTTFRITGIAGEQVFANFEMFKPKINSNSDLKFKIKPINENGKDKLTDLVGKELDIASLFIDDATPGVPSCFPNCGDAGLRGLDMSGQSLFSSFELADFSPKGTTKTNLSGTYLNGANLIGANLSDANLTSANLGGANLTFADLTGADLSNASPRFARLTGARGMVGADLTGAIWENTICPNGTNSDNNPSCGF